MKFIQQFILSVIAYLLIPIVEIATFIVVIFKHGKKALNYFDDEGYKMDVYSAGRNRSLWNLIILGNKGHLPFSKNTKVSISQYIGVNSEYHLTLFGWAVYCILYIIDVGKWKQGGHCDVAKEKYYEEIHHF